MLGPELAAGTLVGDKYRVVRPIGHGAMGTVYEAENTRLGRRVALKVLNREAASNRELVDRFEREAQAAARIGSNHVVDVLEFGDLAGGGQRFMVMEFLEGETLSERLKKKKRLALGEAFSIARQLLDGLEAVHDTGILHRDLKPGNVFLCTTEHGDLVKILDFGVCKFYLNRPEGIVTTESGKLLGTPGYMAPEQLMGGALDARADVYSVGVVLYRIVVGRAPFKVDSLAELILKIKNHDHVPIDEALPEIDAGFAKVVKKAMAKEPRDRYASAAELRDALTHWHADARRLGGLLAEYLERPKGEILVSPPRAASDPETPGADQEPTIPEAKRRSAPRAEDPHEAKTVAGWAGIQPDAQAAPAPAPKVVASARDARSARRPGHAPRWVGKVALVAFLAGAILLLWALMRR